MKTIIPSIKRYLLFALLVIISICCTDKNSKTKDLPLWKPLGNTIPLYSQTNRNALKEMSISTDGNKMAIIDYFSPMDSILLPRKIATYTIKNNLWIPFGNKNKDSSYFTTAETHSMNSNATRIVTGTLNYYPQQTQTFDLKEEHWIMVNDTSFAALHPEPTQIKLSADGNTMAIFSPVLVYSYSKVQVYSWKNKGWVLKGDPITIKNKAAIHYLHYWAANFYWNNVSINDDGSIITVANVYNYDNGPDAGQVKVFKHIDSTWQQVGNDINGTLPYQNLGTSVTISKDDKSLFICSSGRYQKYQYLRYTLEDNIWTKHEDYIPNEFFDHPLMKLSDDGKTLITSKDYKEYSENTYGITIYSRTDTGWKSIGHFDENRDSLTEFILSDDQTRLFVMFAGFNDKYIKVFNTP